MSASTPRYSPVDVVAVAASARLLPTSLVLGEGPLWDAESRCWWFLDITAKKVCRWDGEGEVEVHSMEEEVSTIRKRRSGGLVCVARSGFAHIHQDQQRAAFRLDYLKHTFAEDERHLYMFNDGACDARGRFFAGSKFSQDHPKGADEPVGVLWRLDPDHSLHRVSDGHTIPNGIGWSPDNKIMYFTDSQIGVIWQYDYDLETAEMSNKRVFVNVSADGGEPDGLCIDVEGCIWSARFNGAKVVRWSPEGEELAVLHLPKALNVTCPAFGGPDMDELLVTTAAVTMTPEDMTEDHPWVHSGHVYKYKLPIKGLPSHKFAG